METPGAYVDSMLLTCGAGGGLSGLESVAHLHSWRAAFKTVLHCIAPPPTLNHDNSTNQPPKHTGAKRAKLEGSTPDAMAVDDTLTGVSGADQQPAAAAAAAPKAAAAPLCTREQMVQYYGEHVI